MKHHQLEFTYMRAIAIMLIVAGHSIYLSGQGFPLLLENVLKGATALFVFISGYFYHRVFFPRKQYLDFMRTRIRFVLVPFLWVSLFGFFWLAAGRMEAGASPGEVVEKIYVTVHGGFVFPAH